MASELGHIFCPAADLCRDLDSGMHAAGSGIIPTAADDDQRNKVKKMLIEKAIELKKVSTEPLLKKVETEPTPMPKVKKVSTDPLLKVKTEPRPMPKANEEPFVFFTPTRRQSIEQQLQLFDAWKVKNENDPLFFHADDVGTQTETVKMKNATTQTDERSTATWRIALKKGPFPTIDLSTW